MNHTWEQHESIRKKTNGKYNATAPYFLDFFYALFLKEFQQGQITSFSAAILKELTRFLSFEFERYQFYQPSPTLSWTYQGKFKQLQQEIKNADDLQALTDYIHALFKAFFDSYPTDQEATLPIRNSNEDIEKLIAILKLSHSVGFTHWNQPLVRITFWKIMHQNTVFHTLLYNEHHWLHPTFYRLAKLSANMQISINWNAQDSRGESLFLLLIRMPGDYHTKAVLTLIDNQVKTNIDLNLQNNEGESPLHIAVLTGNQVVYQALLAAGANPKVKDKTGKTPLDYLQEKDLGFIKQKIKSTYSVARIIPIRSANAPHDFIDGFNEQFASKLSIKSIETPYSVADKYNDALKQLNLCDVDPDVHSVFAKLGNLLFNRALLLNLIEAHQVHLNDATQSQDKPPVLFYNPPKDEGTSPLTQTDLNDLKIYVKGLDPKTLLEKTFSHYLLLRAAVKRETKTSVTGLLLTSLWKKLATCERAKQVLRASL